MDRYTRHIQLTGFGQEKQEKLNNSKVLVIGAGGLGCPVLMNLTAMGVGTIGIVDGDIVEEHNLHRQLLYSMEDVGSLKVEAAKKRLHEMNPQTNIICYREYLTTENMLDMVPAYDLLVDGTDQMHTRYFINDLSIALNKPWIYGAVGGFEGQVSFFNIKNEKGEKAHYRDLFPNPEKMHGITNCNQEGVLGVLPNLIGHFMANEATKYLTDLGQVLAGKILHYNLLTNRQHIFEIKAGQHSFLPDIEKVKRTRYESICDVESETEAISWKELIMQDSYILVDVRNQDEVPVITGDNIVKIPLNQLEDRIEELFRFQNIIFVCQSGIRSKQALKIAANSKVEATISHIEGGMVEFLNYQELK